MPLILKSIILASKINNPRTNKVVITLNEFCLHILNKSILDIPRRLQLIILNSQRTKSSEELTVIRFKNAGSKTPIGEVKEWTFCPTVKTRPFPVARFLLAR